MHLFYDKTLWLFLILFSFAVIFLFLVHRYHIGFQPLVCSFHGSCQSHMFHAFWFPTCCVSKGSFFSVVVVIVFVYIITLHVSSIGRIIEVNFIIKCGPWKELMDVVLIRPLVLVSYSFHWCCLFFYLFLWGY